MWRTLALALTGLLTPALAQSLTPDALAELARACPQDAHFRTVHNALCQTDGRVLAMDWQKINAADAHFSHKVPDEPVSNQAASGRCWLFSGLNLFRRAAAAKLDCESFEFSQNYLFFYDKLEKANLYLDAIARTRGSAGTDRRVEWLLHTPIQEGGNWQGLVGLVKKYGVVPKETMPETFSSANSAAMNNVLTIRLRVAGVRLRNAAPDQVPVLKAQALKDVYRILALHLGVPPQAFSYRYQTKAKVLTALTPYTPLAFAQLTVAPALDDFVALYSIPTLPYQKKYQIDLDRAVLEGPDMFFVNCPVDVLKDVARKSLLENQPVWFGADAGQDMARAEGIMVPGLRDYASIYGMDFDMDRRELFEASASTPGHNMLLTGLDLVDGKVGKWLVENSWGDKNGHKGYWTMMDPWFDRFVQVVVVPRRFVPAAVLEVLKTQAETLPPWDPMLAALRYE